MRGGLAPLHILHHCLCFNTTVFNAQISGFIEIWHLCRKFLCGETDVKHKQASMPGRESWEIFSMG